MYMIVLLLGKITKSFAGVAYLNMIVAVGNTFEHDCGSKVTRM